MADTLHATLVPDSTVQTGSWTVTGEPTHHQAIASASDLSYIQQTDAGNHLVNLGTFSLSDSAALPTTGRITTVKVRYRLGGTVPNEGTLVVFLVLATGESAGHAMGPMGTSTGDAWMTLAERPGGEAWTLADVQGAMIVTYAINGTVRLYRVYVEVYVNSIASAIALNPSSPVTTISQPSDPPLEWVYFDADGEPQVELDVRLFSGAGAVADPSTETARYLSGVSAMYSGNSVGANPWPNGDYRWAVRVRDSGTPPGMWSPWSQKTLTFNLPVPNAPGLGVSPNQALARYDIAISSGGGVNPTESFQVERSDDAGLTWRAVYGAGNLPYSGSPVNISDYRAPRMARSVADGGPANLVRYRARAGRLLSGATISGDWTVVAPSSLVGGGVMWLKHPTDPSKSIQVQQLANWETVSEEEMSVLRAASRADWVIFAGVASYEKGDMEMIFAGDAAWKAFEALRKPASPAVPTSLLFQSCFGDTLLDQMWVRLGPNRSVVRVTHAFQSVKQYRRVKVGFFETRSPV